MSQLKKTITSILIILIVIATFTSCGKMQSLEKLDKEKYEISFLSYQGEPKKWYYVDNFYHKVPYDEVSKIYEERRKRQEYSVKKARGDYRPPRVKRWEIYKLADRAFARRKIKKDRFAAVVDEYGNPVDEKVREKDIEIL